MLQRSGFPTQVTTEQLTATLQRSLSGRWREALQPYIWLPSTPGQFMATLAMGLLITTGLMVHVYLSVQVQIARYELYDAREAYETVERHNAEFIYAIAQKASLTELQQRASAAGYVPVTKRSYIDRRILLPAVATAEPMELSAGLEPPAGPVRTGDVQAPVPASVANPVAEWWDSATHQWSIWDRGWQAWSAGTRDQVAGLFDSVFPPRE